MINGFMLVLKKTHLLLFALVAVSACPSMAVAGFTFLPDNDVIVSKTCTQYDRQLKDSITTLNNHIDIFHNIRQIYSNMRPRSFEDIKNNFDNIDNIVDSYQKAMAVAAFVDALQDNHKLCIDLKQDMDSCYRDTYGLLSNALSDKVLPKEIIRYTPWDKDQKNALRDKIVQGYHDNQLQVTLG
jgi:hypothetical protein